MKKPGSERVTSDITVQQFNHTSTSIGGTADGLKRSLKELEDELKKDEEGKKEYETYLKQLETKRADLERQVKEHKAWLEAVEKQGSNSSEAQYKRLLEQIQSTYDGAKEVHGKGIDMLIKDFGYHIAYKRWNDSFTAIPFKPK